MLYSHFNTNIIKIYKYLHKKKYKKIIGIYFIIQIIDKEVIFISKIDKLNQFTHFINFLDKLIKLNI